MQGVKGGGPEYRTRRPEQSALHLAVREGWPVVAAAAAERGGLPKRVHEEVRRYLQCGVLRHGFVHVKCDECGVLVQGARVVSVLWSEAGARDGAAPARGVAGGGVPPVDAVAAGGGAVGGPPVSGKLSPQFEAGHQPRARS